MKQNVISVYLTGNHSTTQNWHLKIRLQVTECSWRLKATRAVLGNVGAFLHCSVIRKLGESETCSLNSPSIIHKIKGASPTARAIKHGFSIFVISTNTLIFFFIVIYAV